MEAFLQPPDIFIPGEAYYSDENREFQGIPAIERSPSGRLWAAWYGGGVTEDRRNYVILATSNDGGTTWSKPVLVIDPGRDGPVRAYDPCLWHDPDGTLRLYWSQGYERHTDETAGVWTISTGNSDDENPEWSSPTRLCDGVMMNKPIVTSSGAWLFPVARWKTDESAQVYEAIDHNVNWKLAGAATVSTVEDRNADEHMIVERNAGEILMLIRTSYGIGESVSKDTGKTWSKVVPSNLAHPVSRFNIRRLASGALLLVKHGPLEVKTERCDLSAYVSADDGLTWTGGLLIDERSGVSYPDTVEDEDGTIYCIYDYDRRGAREILLSRFTEDDVKSGKFASEKSAQRLIINKAG